MKIRIKLQNNREIETEIEKEEYDELKKGLAEGKIKFLNFENQFLKTTLIESIEPIAETISKEFRLVAPKFEKADQIKGMEKLFNLLKSKGLFKDYLNYQMWGKK